MKSKILIICSLLLTVMSFKPGDGKTGITGPAAIIYKTRADYSKLVPVTLSADKSQIVSYPAVQDIYRNGALAYPTPLAKGFLLDNRGITPNSAFLKLTYEEYAKLNPVPSLDELYKLIVDKDPFIEIYNLGNRRQFKDETREINHLIEKHKLKGFKKLK